MAHFKTGKYHHIDIIVCWFARGLLAIKRAVIYKNHTWSYNYDAFGIAAIGIGVLFVTGI